MSYVHGYDPKENTRLQDQANTLTELLHGDTVYPAGSHVLEAGCGVGAQTVALATNSPAALITSVDISGTSIAEAEAALAATGSSNVRFLQADIFCLPYEPESFDHVFVCFVLEHLSDPAAALRVLGTYLRPGGTLTVIEGDHGLVCFHPESDAARRAISCQVELQRRAGGNAMIGRQLYPLLSRAGFVDVRVSPRMVYVDANRPELADGFTRKTFAAMVAGVRTAALEAGLAGPDEFDQGISDLHRTAADDGVFCYTFFKALARKPSAEQTDGNGSACVEAVD